MNIGIIGLGFVGLSISSVLASKNYNVVGIDIDNQKCSDIRNGVLPLFEPELENTLRIGLKKKLTISNNFSLIKNCDMIFVTVGTPQTPLGAVELSMIKKAATTIGQIIRKSKKNPIIFIKSTVIPGTAQNVILPILEKKSGKKADRGFGIISNPEFLQESNAIRDTKYPHAIVLGGKQSKYMKKAKMFFSKMHPNVPIVITNFETAEMIKYANNSFLATKISFINQLSNICQKTPGVNVDDIARTIGLDPRIGKLFLNAGPGYGGSCLPKDMKALINFANISGINPTLLNAVEDINSKQLEQIITIAKQQLIDLKSKRITILGTAFKPNTDDIRDSKSIELIKKLVKNKANITIHDPKAIENTKKIFGEKILYATSIADALNKAQCVIIMTHWKQYDTLNNNSIKHMSKKIIIDCRRVLVKKELDAEYYAIGIGKN
jgi:UDPglucose 6-dehydrogenase